MMRLRHLYHSKGVRQMKTRKMMVAAVVAMATLSLGSQLFAATQSQSGTRLQIKDGTCTNKKYAESSRGPNGTGTQIRIKDGTCVNR